MKSNFMLILCTLTALTATAQELPKVEWGQAYKRPNFSDVTKIIGSDGSGVYVWRDKNGSLASPEVIIEKYDNALNLAKSTTLNVAFSALNSDVQMVDIFPFAQKIISLISVYDGGNDENTLFAQTIDRQTLQLNNDKQEVARIAAKRRGNRGNFAYNISRDSSKMVVYTTSPQKMWGSAEMSLNVYDEELRLIWKKDVLLPFRDRDFSVESVEIDDEGNVYVLGQLFEGNGGLFVATPNYRYVIAAYRASGEEQKYDISLGEDFISDLSIRVGNAGELLCAGFYSERSTAGMKGAFFAKINEANSGLYEIKKGAFPTEFLAQFMSKRRAKKQRELFSYRIDELVLRSDGGALMIAEQFYVRVVTSSDLSGFQTTTTTYHYNDIIAVNINPDGTIAWATKIPKRQSDGSGAFSSYSFMISGGKIHFIYNDHPKNLNRTDFRKIKNFNSSNSIVVLASLKPDGSYTKKPLFDNRSEAITTRPRIARQVSKDELILFGSLNKRYKFGRLTF